MNKELKIQCCKCLLVLNESQLFQGLRPEVLQQALERGKGYKRAISCEQRQNHIDRWQVYEWLKGNKVPENMALLIESMPIRELKEGIIEYILSLMKGGEK